MNEQKRKTVKVLDMHLGGHHVEFILRLDNADPNPIRIYKLGVNKHTECNDDCTETWSYSTKSRKQIGKAACLVDALKFLYEYYATGAFKKDLH